MTDFRPGSFKILPEAVKNLIIINAIVFLAQNVLEKFNINLTDILGLHYWRSHYFKPWQFITHMFMHGDIMHIFSNMFALWMFGSILENVWGAKRFLIFYLVCGFGAAMLHMGVVGYEFHSIGEAFIKYQQNPTLDQFDLFLKQHVGANNGIGLKAQLYALQHFWENVPSADLSAKSVNAINQYLYGLQVSDGYVQGIYDEATVGASGAVFGILFAFGYLFPNTLLYLYFLVPVKAKYVVGAYALFEIYAGIRNSAGDNIAHFAHLGGMLVGFILLKIWNKNNRKHFY